MFFNTFFAYNAVNWTFVANFATEHAKCRYLFAIIANEITFCHLCKVKLVDVKVSSFLRDT